MSTKSSIWLGEDEHGSVVHIYWELGERDVELKTAPIYVAIEHNGKKAEIQLPKETAEAVAKAFQTDSWKVL